MSLPVLIGNASLNIAFFLYLVLYFLNIGIIHLLHDFISDLYLDGGIAIVLLAFASYYANKHFVFRNVL